MPCTEFVIENVTEKQLEAHKNKILVVLTGGMYPEAQKAVRSVLLEDGYADMYILRFIKPFDESYFLELAKKYYGIVFVEDGTIKYDGDPAGFFAPNNPDERIRHFIAAMTMEELEE